MKGIIKVDSNGRITGSIKRDLPLLVEPDFSIPECKNLYKNICKYMSSKPFNNVTNLEDIEPERISLIDEGLSEVRALTSFRIAFCDIDLINDDGYKLKNGEVNLESKSLKNLFDKNKSNTVLVTAGTIGNAVDKRMEIYKKTNVSKMILLNSCSSAYVEYLYDMAEKIILEELGLSNPSFRFAPGYGDVPLDRQSEIFKLFEEYKPELKIELNEKNFMYPVKSMTGLTGCIR